MGFCAKNDFIIYSYFIVFTSIFNLIKKHKIRSITLVVELDDGRLLPLRDIFFSDSEDDLQRMNDPCFEL